MFGLLELAAAVAIGGFIAIAGILITLFVLVLKMDKAGLFIRY